MQIRNRRQPSMKDAWWWDIMPMIDLTPKTSPESVIRPNFGDIYHFPTLHKKWEGRNGRWASIGCVSEFFKSLGCSLCNYNIIEVAHAANRLVVKGSNGTSFEVMTYILSTRKLKIENWKLINFLYSLTQGWAVCQILYEVPGQNG